MDSERYWVVYDVDDVGQIKAGPFCHDHAHDHAKKVATHIADVASDIVILPVWAYPNYSV